MDSDDAVACIQYDFDKYVDTKFNERKMFLTLKTMSSLMIFNNVMKTVKNLHQKL